MSFPDIPTGYAVPLVDQSTDLLPADTMTALDARYWVPAVGFAASDTTQAITDDTDTTLTFSAATLATGGITFSTNGFTVPTAGVYRVTAYARFDVDATGVRELEVNVNATENRYVEARNTAIGSNWLPLGVSVLVSLAASDVVKAAVRQTSGGDLDILHKSLSVEWVG